MLEYQLCVPAIVVLVILAVSVLPFVTIRSALMEMDRIVTSKKLLDVSDINF